MFHEQRNAGHNRDNTFQTYAVGLISGMMLMYLLHHTGALRIQHGFGVSNGKPYTLQSIQFTTRLIEPKIGDYVSHWINGRYVTHRLTDIKLNTYVFEAYVRENKVITYEIPARQIENTQLLKIPLRTTNNFTEACIYERVRSGMNVGVCYDGI